MQTQVEKSELRLTAQEDWTTDQTIILHAEIMSALRQYHCSGICLDLSQILKMDAGGLKLLLGLFKTCKENGLAFRVLIQSLKVFQLFEACKLGDMMDVQLVADDG